MWHTNNYRRDTKKDIYRFQLEEKIWNKDTKNGLNGSYFVEMLNWKNMEKQDCLIKLKYLAQNIDF